MQACANLGKKVWSRIGGSLKKAFCECGHIGDRCCNCCCGVFGDCIQGGTQCIADFFDRPYAFFACAGSVFCISPLIYGAVAFFDSNNLTCEYPIRAHLMVLVIGHFLNGLFSIYCTIRFGNHNKSLIGKSGNGEGENVLMRIMNMISYEIPVCLYLIYGLFMFIWLILGHAWMNALPSNSECNDDSSVANNLRTADLVASIFMWLFVFGGFLLSIITTTTYSCDEGSCISWDVCRFIGMFLTCGLFDLAKRSKKGPAMVHSAHERYLQNKTGYSAIRWNWIPKMKEICLELGFGSRNTPKLEAPANTTSLVDIKHFKKVNNGLTAMETSINISHNETAANFQNNPASQFFEERRVTLPSQSLRNNRSPSNVRHERSESVSVPVPQANVPKIKSFHQINQI